MFAFFKKLIFTPPTIGLTPREAQLTIFIKNNDVVSLRNLLYAGLDEGRALSTNTTIGPAKQSLLMAAIKFGSIDIIRFLLTHDSLDVNQVGKDGETPLMHAIEKQHREIFNLLTQRKDLNVDKATIYDTPLIIASREADSYFVEQLLKKGAQFLRSEHFHYTPLMAASLYGHVDNVKLLLEALNGNHQKLLDALNAEDKTGRTGLSHAVSGNQLEVVKILLSYDADQNRSEVLVVDVIPGGDSKINIINAFLQGPIDVNWADRNSKDRTALMKACALGNIEIVKLLLKRKELDINVKDKDGNNALMLAVLLARRNITKSKDIVEQLLAHERIGINAKNPEGKTALDLANEYNLFEIAQLIRSKTATEETTKEEEKDEGNKKNEKVIITASQPSLAEN